MVAELKEQYIVENSLRIHLIPMKHFYGVKFLKKNGYSFLIFHQLFQLAKEPFLTIIQLYKKLYIVKVF